VAVLLRVLTYVVIIVTCAAVGGGAGWYAPYMSADDVDSPSYRSRWDVAKDETTGDIKKRFAIGGVVGAVVGGFFAASCVVRPKEGELRQRR